MENQKQIRPNRPVIATQRPATESTLTPKDVFVIIRRCLFLIIAMTILGFMVGGGGWYLLSRYYPKYTAQTLIRVLPPIEKDPMVIVGGQVGKDLQYGYRFSMASLIKQQSTLENLLSRVKVQETKWFASLGKTQAKRIEEGLGDLKKYLTVHAQRDGEFIVLSMTCGDAKEARDIVNEMLDLFIDMRGGTKKAEVRAGMGTLTKQLIRVQGELRREQNALDAVSEDTGFSDLNAGGDFRNTITLKLDSLELEQNQLILDITNLEAITQNYERQSIGPIQEQVGHLIENDPIMITLGNQRAALETDLAGKLTKFGEYHREVRRTQQLINEVTLKREDRKTEIAELTRQANLKDALDQLIVLKERYSQLEELRKEAEKKQWDLNRAKALYEERLLARDERQRMHDEIKAQIEIQKIVLEDPETPKVQRVGYAPMPREMSSPKWQVFFPGGTILGLMLGVGLAFLIELLNDLVRTPRDVIRYLRIPLLGVIPDSDEDNLVGDSELCHVVQKAPYSIISESYRRFRTNLKLSNPSESCRVLLVGSGMPGDGNTSVVVNLATLLAAENKKVLIIETNFMSLCFSELFPENETSEQSAQQNGCGLSELLTNQCSYEDAIRPNGIEGMDVIVGGALPSSPAELLSCDNMKLLIEKQRQNYDYIIIDGPPILLVSDIKSLARFVDDTVLVFNAAATRRGAAQRTIRELREVDANIVGCVLFAVKAMKGGYFNENFKSYRKYQKLQLARSI